MAKLNMDYATPEGTFVYPSVFEARAYKDAKTGKEDKARFSAKLILDPAAAKRFAATLRAIAAKEAPDVAPEDFHLPLVSGAKEAERRRKLGKNDALNDVLEGNYLFSASTVAEYQPQVFDEMGAPTTDRRLAFSGARGHIGGKVNVYQDAKTGDYKVSAYLNSVLFVRGAGEPIPGLGGKRDAGAIFGAVRALPAPVDEDIPF